MSETNSEHEQTKSGARGIRRVERAGQHQPDPNRPTASRRTGDRAEHQPERTDRTVRAGADQSQLTGQITGGILRQLIAKADSQLARLDDRVSQLEAERQKLDEERQEARQEKEQLQTILENLRRADQEGS